MNGLPPDRSIPDAASPLDALYETLHALSSRLADAARANRWDAVMALGPQVQAVSEAIRAAGPDDVAGAQMYRRVQLTRRIVEALGEADRHVTPWLNAVRSLLGASQLKARVASVYSSVE